METAKRVDKTNYYLDIAQTVAARGTCLRRNFGAIIVKNDEIMSVHPEEGKTAATWATAPAKNSTSPAANVMSCAARCTPRPMPSSARPAPR